MGMALNREEAISAARKLLRTFASSPEPRRQARAIQSTLAGADGWSLAEQDSINALGVWLAEMPTEVALRPRCDDVLRGLIRR